MLQSTAFKRMKCKRNMGHLLIALLAVGALSLPTRSWSQDSPSPGPDMEASAKTQILSRPTGAIVSFDGEYDLAGRAPYTIAYHLKGYYKIRARKWGYEDWTGEFLFTGKGNEKLSIKLSPKTRAKALYRSVLFPGWGQAYADQKLKGAIIATTQLTSLGMFIYQNVKYNSALDNFNAASTAFRQGQNDATQRPTLLAALQAAQTRLDDRYEKRRLTALFAGTIYAYNLLDILLFFPNYHHNGVAVDMNLAMPTVPDAPGAMLNIQTQF